MRSAAAAARTVFWLVADLTPRKGRWQRHTARLHPRGSRFFLKRFDFWTDRLDVRVDALVQQ